MAAFNYRAACEAERRLREIYLSISGQYMLLCKTFVKAEFRKLITMQRIRAF